MKTYQKRVWTCAVIVTLILFCYTFSFAQMENIKGARFKDGTIIYGKVIEMNINNIRIETKDGEIISRKFDDVAEIIKDTGVDEKDNKVISKLHTWEIVPEISYIEYKEPGVMKEEGTMFGIGVSYAYRNDVMIKIAGRYSYGLVDYQNSGTINNIDNIMFEIRMIGGYDFKISNSFTMTPFIGFGYRFLEDDSAGRMSSTGAYGYLRESNYYYSPLGIEAVNVFDNGWSAGVILEYDHFWKGKQKSYLSDVDPGVNDISNDQNGGYGLRGSINIKKQTERAFYAIEPFIRYWSIDKSDNQNLTYYGTPTGYVGYEPKNESTEIGINFMIGF